ncbi:lysoplasmalogenase [Plantibacter sp. YIM 135347]|uniref:lysoplasmalogenase n=1 Tax=Plantibacter sp. YIM 135347 TaxID=3423919 RepID=UPI003D326FFB
MSGPDRPSTMAVFAVFPVIAMVHVAGLALDLSWLSLTTKPLIMLSLAVALVWSVTAISRALIVTLVAILCSWLGDLALMVPGEIPFLLGIVGFMLAQAAYVILFRTQLRTRRLPWWSLVYVLWLAIGVWLLVQQSMGPLLPAVIVYGAVIGAMAASATATTPMIAAGGALFLISDSLIAIDRFVPSLPLWAADELIMIGYCAGQGLIVFGVARVLRARAATRVRAGSTSIA